MFSVEKLKTILGMDLKRDDDNTNSKIKSKK